MTLVFRTAIYKVYDEFRLVTIITVLIPLVVVVLTLMCKPHQDNMKDRHLRPLVLLCDCDRHCFLMGLSQYHSSTNGVEHSIAPSAWQSLSLMKCQILASVFIVVRFSDFAFLAF